MKRHTPFTTLVWGSLITRELYGFPIETQLGASGPPENQLIAALLKERCMMKRHIDIYLSLSLALVLTLVSVCISYIHGIQMCSQLDTHVRANTYYHRLPLQAQHNSLSTSSVISAVNLCSPK